MSLSSVYLDGLNFIAICEASKVLNENLGNQILMSISNIQLFREAQRHLKSSLDGGLVKPNKEAKFRRYINLIEELLSEAEVENCNKLDAVIGSLLSNQNLLSASELRVYRGLRNFEGRVRWVNDNWVKFEVCSLNKREDFNELTRIIFLSGIRDLLPDKLNNINDSPPSEETIETRVKVIARKLNAFGAGNNRYTQLAFKLLENIITEEQNGFNPNEQMSEENIELLEAIRRELADMITNDFIQREHEESMSESLREVEELIVEHQILNALNSRDE